MIGPADIILRVDASAFLSDNYGDIYQSKNGFGRIASNVKK